MGPLNTNPVEPSTITAAPPVAAVDQARLETAARSAFAKHVNIYDDQDEFISHLEPQHLRLVYVSVRGSRQSGSATLVQCRVEDRLKEMWINSLQVSQSLRRQGLGRELVEAVEATAQAIGMSSVKVYPLADSVGFWKSLVYVPDSRTARVLQKTLT